LNADVSSSFSVGVAATWPLELIFPECSAFQLEMEKGILIVLDLCSLCLVEGVMEWVLQKLKRTLFHYPVLFHCSNRKMKHQRGFDDFHYFACRSCGTMANVSEDLACFVSQFYWKKIETPLVRDWPYFVVVGVSQLKSEK